MIASAEPLVIMTRAELDALINQAARAAVAQIAAKLDRPAVDELWDARQCASYLRVSPYTIAHEWAHQRGFPAAVTLGDGPRAKRRWKADEIREWAIRRKSKAA